MHARPIVRTFVPGDIYEYFIPVCASLITIIGKIHRQSLTFAVTHTSLPYNYRAITHSLAAASNYQADYNRQFALVTMLRLFCIFSSINVIANLCAIYTACIIFPRLSINSFDELRRTHESSRLMKIAPSRL